MANAVNFTNETLKTPSADHSRDQSLTVTTNQSQTLITAGSDRPDQSLTPGGGEA